MNETEDRLRGGPAPDWESVRGGLLERAEAEKLIELAYEAHESPFGRLLVVASGEGVVRVSLATEPEAEVLDDLAVRLSPRIGRLERPVITEARRQLDRYFVGELRTFDLPLDWRLTRGFRREVLLQTALIPYGLTASYTDLAARAGSPKAVRAAGSALATNPLPVIVPCHRVLRADGAVGSYLGGSPMKAALLELERTLSEDGAGRG